MTYQPELRSQAGASLKSPQKSFIEVQFPVAKLSKESYSERKGAQGQTLTGLGKWWGRKPLVLVRALILGLLLPATDNPKKDLDTFLAVMTMDEDGLEARIESGISAKVSEEYLSPNDAMAAIEHQGASVKWRKGLSAEERKKYQLRAFRAMSYEKQIEFCVRPEEIDGPTADSWARINEHLDTDANSLPELVQQLGERRWGRTPKIGDAFSGGGSIPFEAARLGCDVFASDINPVAGLLTWGALNIVGGGTEVVERVKRTQQLVFESMRRQVDEWGIERNEQGWIADAYLYCAEVRDPVTGWLVPLAPSWVVARRAEQAFVKLIPDIENKRFDLEVVTGATPAQLAGAEDAGTAKGGLRNVVDRDGNWLPVNQRQTTSIEQLRGANGLRKWTNDDVVPRPEDVYQERLYCIRWLDPKTGKRHYRAPDASDLEREERVLELLRERFDDWQAEGYIPSRRIEPGYNTDQPIRERGWTHWHHLFNPRQLLLGGLLFEAISRRPEYEQRLAILLVGRFVNWNSRLTPWNHQRDQGTQTFYNQALNVPNNYSCRPMSLVEAVLAPPFRSMKIDKAPTLELGDARGISEEVDIWLTDPGYGDTINYDEISEYFLAWYEKRIAGLFPSWYSDSRRALNIKGEGENFRIGLTQAYTNLSLRTHESGFQVVMFTHQDPTVWADVGLTLWASGLQVLSAWTVATETPSSGIKGGGNYIQGTVCLVLRKRTNQSKGYLSDIHPEIQDEVRRQIESMQELDDAGDPNFGDADYQLAAYAAALRVLTSYASIDEIDIERELRRPRQRGEVSPITKLIEQAVRIANDAIVPHGLETASWRRLSPEERLYLKAIEIEGTGEARQGVYHELARSYGAGAHDELYASTAANAVRFNTASEFAGRDLGTIGEAGFRGSLLRRLLYAVYQAAADDEHDPRSARQSLRTDLQDYWTQRAHLIELLGFLIAKAQSLSQWRADVEAMRLLKSSLENDTV